MSKYCSLCLLNRKTFSTEEFNISVSTNNLIYSEYLGDGDTSSFTDVVARKPYEKYNIDPVKLECVGHVQKRMGTRLHNLVKQHKGTLTPLYTAKHRLRMNPSTIFYG